MPDIDLLAEFKAAMATYRKSRDDFAKVDRQFAGHGADRAEQPVWFASKNAASLAVEDLWISAMAGLFSLLETNYKAQERLVEKQLKLAEEQTDSAKSMAKWTKRLVIVTCLLIAVTGVVGLCGPIFSRAQSPIEVRLIAPGPGYNLQAPAPSRADPQSPQSPTRDQ